jgi:hypothetical protein
MYLYYRKSEMEYLSTIIKSQTEYGVFNIIESLQEIKRLCMIKRPFQGQCGECELEPTIWCQIK